VTGVQTCALPIYSEELMEAVHVAGAVRGGASLVHGVQMMNKYKSLSM